MTDNLPNPTPTPPPLRKPPRKWEPVVMVLLVVAIAARAVETPEAIVLGVLLAPLLIAWLAFYLQRRNRYRRQVGNS